MADEVRISELDPLPALSDSDEVPVVDKSDLAEGATGTTKRATLARLTGFSTYDALRAALAAGSIAAGDTLRTASRTTVGDGGEGEWRCVAIGSYVDNGGTILTGGSFAALRKHGESYRCEWFGAVGDGVTDDTASLQAALNAASDSGAVEFGAKTYRTVLPLSISASCTVRGTGPKSVLFCDGANESAIEISNTSHVTIRDFKIVGNSTGAGGTAVGSGGNGITIVNCTDITIAGVAFEAIGLPTGSTHASCVMANDAARLVVTGCRFYSSCRSLTGADLFLSYRVTEVVISNNYSNSEHDMFVYLNAVADTDDQLGKISVTGNVAIRENEIARHAVLAAYGAHPAYCAIAGNTFEGFAWTGVYLTCPSPLTFAGVDSGGIAVTGNVFRFCGGLGDICSTIWLSGTAGAVCSGNLVYGNGYDRDFVQRATGPSYGTSAIRVNQTAMNIAISGNSVQRSASHGITVYCNTYDCADILIANNSITQCGSRGISLESSSCNIDRVSITGNIVSVDNGGDAACWIRGNVGVIGDFLFSGNTLYSTTASGVTYGVYVHSVGGASGATGVISDNVISGFVEGFRLGTVSTPGESTQLEIPDKLQLWRNKFVDCATGVRGYEKMITFGSVFVDCATDTHASVWNGSYIGTNVDGDIIVEVTGTAAPTTRTWRKGDKVVNGNPSAGGVSGWVCTTAGTPGIWKSFGAISA